MKNISAGPRNVIRFICITCVVRQEKHNKEMVIGNGCSKDRNTSFKRVKNSQML